MNDSKAQSLQYYVRFTLIFSVLLLFCTFSMNNSIAFSQTITNPNTYQNRMSLSSYSSPSNVIRSNNDLLKTNDTKSNVNTATTNMLIVKLLANNLENHLQKAGAILNITSQLPQVRNTSFAYLLNQTLSTLHGIPQNADTEKREIAKNILASDKDLFEILFIMPNGDVYIHEPYSRQQALTTTNLSFRDYFQGAIKTNDTYLGNLIVSRAFGTRTALIATPVYSLKGNSSINIAGIWAGGIDFSVLNKELQSLNLTGTAGERIIYLDHNGNKIADSNADKATLQESFVNLTSFKNAAINGQSGSTIETLSNNNTKMIITYQPVKVFHNTWAVLLIQQQPPANQTIDLQRQ